MDAGLDATKKFKFKNKNAAILFRLPSTPRPEHDLWVLLLWLQIFFAATPRSSVNSEVPMMLHLSHCASQEPLYSS